jgi:predicted O-methyltransferase YrrM
MKRGSAYDTCEVMDQGGYSYMGVRRILQGIVVAQRPDVVVEIGTYKGFTTACMALTGKIHKSEIWTIDLLRAGQEPNVEDIVGKDHGVHFIKGVRAQEVNWEKEGDGRPIDLLFIDGDHGEEPTREIWRKWSKLVAPGGIIVFHDATETKKGRMARYGVWKVIDEIKWPKCLVVPRKPGICVVHKPDDDLELGPETRVDQIHYVQEKEDTPEAVKLADDRQDEEAPLEPLREGDVKGQGRSAPPKRPKPKISPSGQRARGRGGKFVGGSRQKKGGKDV